jgi:predicted enzyme related to lactoylglutathione lyase
MPEFSSYPAGTPSWVDLASSDVDAAARFYGELFGWDAAEAGPAEETGGYRMFTLRGKQVAGLGPLQQEGQPPAWTTYIASDNADQTAEKASGAGGQVFLPPFDVLDAGRMTVIADPTGAVFGIWQAGRHTGAQLANEPGTFAWNELRTRDIAAAKSFYNAVFSWDDDTQDFAGGQYTMFKVGDNVVAGGMDMGELFPAEVPPHWGVYFVVEDCDAAAAKVRDLGGQVQSEPMTTSAGRMGAVVDPQGAAFSIIDPSTTAS